MIIIITIIIPLNNRISIVIVRQRACMSVLVNKRNKENDERRPPNLCVCVEEEECVRDGEIERKRERVCTFAFVTQSNDTTEYYICITTVEQ